MIEKIAHGLTRKPKLVALIAVLMLIPSVIGYAGDWTQAKYGIVEDVQISISDQATLTIDDEQVNLWERNMFAVRAEIEFGFRADTSVFNALTATGVPSI